MDFIAEEGKRIRFEINGERYYVTGTRAADGGIDFTPTVPFENRPEMIKERLVVEKLCSELSKLTRMVFPLSY